MPGQLVELDERTVVEQLLDPLARGLLALLVLLLDRLRGRSVHRLLEASGQVGVLAGGGVGVVVLGDLGALAGLLADCFAHGSSRFQSLRWANLVPVPAADPSRPSLDAATLAEAAGPRWRVEVVDASPSTNADVAERARQGETAGLVLVAEHQTAGRGRLDRVWVTPPRAALTVSVLLDVEKAPPGRWPWLPLLAGLAVSDAVREVTGLDAPLKWPNDVLVSEYGEHRKVAGLLVELVERPAGTAAVVGVGLNVSSTRGELPVETATSLLLAGADRPDRGALLLAMLSGFSRRFDEWVSGGGRGPLSSYVAACSTLGRDVRVDLPDGRSLQGRAVDVDEWGRLLVDDAAGEHALGAGDVVHVRAADTR